MIDMNTTIKRENSLSPTPTVKSEVIMPAVKKSSFFSIDQILGKREAEMCDEDVFVKENSDTDSMEGEKIVDYNVNIEDDELTDTEDIVDEDQNNNNPDSNNDDEKTKDDKDSKNDKQTPSYTAIIAQAILSSTDKKLPLGCIYDYIAEHFPEFLKKGQGWRNCVRHNLSLSECFIKAGRARNGRGNYWGIHPRYIKNFSKGDFRKRRASHRPRNRDLGLIGYGFGRYYPYYYNPYAVNYGYNKAPALSPNSRSGFSVDNILSKEQRTETSVPPAISHYKTSTWSPRDYAHHAERSRKRLCSPPRLSSVVPTSHTYLENYNYPSHQHHHHGHHHGSHHQHTSSYEYRSSATTSECACRSYTCPSASSRTHTKL